MKVNSTKLVFNCFKLHLLLCMFSTLVAKITWFLGFRKQIRALWAGKIDKDINIHQITYPSFTLVCNVCMHLDVYRCNTMATCLLLTGQFTIGICCEVHWNPDSFGHLWFVLLYSDVHYLADDGPPAFTSQQLGFSMLRCSVSLESSV